MIESYDFGWSGKMPALDALLPMFFGINSEENMSCCLCRHWPGNWSLFSASECQHRHVCWITAAASARPQLFNSKWSICVVFQAHTLRQASSSPTKRFFIKCLMIIDETSSTSETRCQLKNSRWISHSTANNRQKEGQQLKNSAILI